MNRLRGIHIILTIILFSSCSCRMVDYHKDWLSQGEKKFTLTDLSYQRAFQAIMRYLVLNGTHFLVADKNTGIISFIDLESVHYLLKVESRGGETELKIKVLEPVYRLQLTESEKEKKEEIEILAKQKESQIMDKLLILEECIRNEAGLYNWQWLFNEEEK